MKPPTGKAFFMLSLHYSIAWQTLLSQTTYSTELVAVSTFSQTAQHSVLQPDMRPTVYVPLQWQQQLGWGLCGSGATLLGIICTLLLA